MTRKPTVKAIVNDLGQDNGKRRVEIILEGPQDIFQLSDVLSQQGALEGLDSVLRAATKSAAADYINSGSLLVKRLQTNGAGGEGR